MMTTTEQILEAWGYYLRAAAGGSKVSNAAAGAALGVAGSTIGRWLNDPSSMPGRSFIELCRVYEVSPDEMFTQAVARARRNAGTTGEKS